MSLFAFALKAEAADVETISLGAFQSETTIYNPKLAFLGATLMAVPGAGAVVLMNMRGQRVHTWPVEALRARLLPNCNLLVVHGKDSRISKSGRRKLMCTVREYDWRGAVVWEFEAPSPVHHDVVRLENGSTLFPYRKVLSYELPSEAGGGTRRVRSDVVLEVSPAGKILWEWKAEEHLDLNSCGKRACSYPVESERWIEQQRDWTHINTVAPLPPNKWFQGGDERFRPGNVMLLPRNWWMSVIVDRSTKNVVWQYSGGYKGGLLAPHESHMIPEGLPGAGNILIFDNGGRVRKSSIALEINPITRKRVWSYEDGERFYSRAGAALQRLPNGNTLLSEDVRGRVFEVSPEGGIVWELRNSHYVSRAKRYGPDYCSELNKLHLE